MRLLRLVGKGLAIIGVPIFLFFGYSAFVLLFHAGEHGSLPTGVEFVPLIALLGLTMTTVGVYLLRKFEEPVLLLTKAGEPIHIGEIWKKGKSLDCT